MEKEENETKFPPTLVLKKRYNAEAQTGSPESLPEPSNLSRKQKTSSLSLFYPHLSPPPLGIRNPFRKLEYGGGELKGDVPVTRKPCKCKQSSCMKLYCWCFASGKYCNGCSCSGCQNNGKNEEARQAALQCILERHHKSLRAIIFSSPKLFADSKDDGKGDLILVSSIGCCCKRSKCIQGYCECYQANIFCSETCKCKHCENFKRCAQKSSKESKKVKDKEKFLDSPKEDQLNCRLGQSWTILRKGAQNPLKFSYRRSLLAGIIQLHNLTDFCELLIVTSEAVKSLADTRNLFDLENLGVEQRVKNAAALMDSQVEGPECQGPRPEDHLSGVQIDVVDFTSNASMQDEWPLSPDPVSLKCDEKDVLFPPDASSDKIRRSGCCSNVYMEQENFILEKFLDFLNWVISCGNAKELELSTKAKRKDDEKIFSHKSVLQS